MSARMAEKEQQKGGGRDAEGEQKDSRTEADELKKCIARTVEGDRRTAEWGQKDSRMQGEDTGMGAEKQLKAKSSGYGWL